MKNPAPIKSPTRAFITESRKVPGYTFFTLVHGLVYGYFTYLYIGVGKGEHPTRQGWQQGDEKLAAGISCPTQA